MVTRNHLQKPVKITEAAQIKKDYFEFNLKTQKTPTEYNYLKL